MARSIAVRRSRIRRAKLKIRERSGRIRVALAGFVIGLGVLFLTTVGASLGIAFGIYRQYTKDLVAPEQVLAGQARVGSRIYDRNGKLLYEFTDPEGGIRRPVVLQDISPAMILATICTEDPSFYVNPGINPRGLARAAYENLFPYTPEQRFQGSGGSSITQQLVKLTFIPQEERARRSLDRKLKETALALALTQRYSKDQILEWYLNNVFYGNNAYGVGAAAQRYFGKAAKDLTLAEASLLAGLPQSPGRYDPYTNWEEAKRRQATILRLMVEHGCLTQEEAEEALATELQLAPQAFPVEAPHFVFSYLRPLLESWFGKNALYRAGLQITTSLDLDFQKRVEAILDEEIRRVERACQCHNGAVMVIRPETGEILAYVGSRNYWDETIEGKVDNLQAVKQPGSSFKPIVYLAYFMTRNAGPTSTIMAGPYQTRETVITDPRPIPPGPVSIRVALGSSLNTPAARAAEAIGADTVIRVANRMGYTTMGPEDIRQRRYGPSIATGGANLTLFEHTFAFATLANNGEMRGQRAARNYGEGMRKIDPTSILKVTTERGTVLYEFLEPVREQVVPANYAYLVTSILSDCTARYLIWSCGYFDIGRPYAVKTGTQQGLDVRLSNRTLYNWQMGYTPDLAVGVWIGNQNNQPVSSANFETANAANAVWRRVMQLGHKDLPPRPFTEPPGIERRQALVGRPGSTNCAATGNDVWAHGDAPSPEDQCRAAGLQPSPTPTPAPGDRQPQAGSPPPSPAASPVPPGAPAAASTQAGLEPQPAPAQPPPNARQPLEPSPTPTVLGSAGQPPPLTP